MTIKNKIRADIIFSCIIMFSFLAFVGLIFKVSKIEGGIGNNAVVNLIADYMLYVFPLSLLFKFIPTPFSYFMLLGLNIILYCFISIAFLEKKLSISKKYNPFNLTHFSAYLIVAMTLIFFLLLINSN